MASTQGPELSQSPLEDASHRRAPEVLHVPRKKSPKSMEFETQSRGSGDASKGGQENGPSQTSVTALRVLGALLFLVGVMQVIVGGMLFAEWGNVGSFWVGLLAIMTGAAATRAQGNQPKGGSCASIAVSLAVVTMLTAVVSVLFLEGGVYSVMMEVEGCETSMETTDFGGRMGCSRDCTCIANDGTTWCVSYAGDCEDMTDTEDLLLTSTISLSVAAVVAMALTFSGCSAALCSQRKS